MMVRNFLRICHTLYVLLFALSACVTTASPATAAAADRGVGIEIDKFMTGYARDLTKRIGPGSRVEYNISAVAANAEGRSCATPLAISAREQTQSLSRVTLLAACGNEWSIYIPVDLNIYRAVVIASKPLASGTVIAADDVELSSLEVSQLVGAYLTTLDDAIGMGVKRPIAQGRPIFSQQLEQPILIRRGESVIISAESGILAVKMTGTALADGRRGELIRVKNLTSARIIDARVIAPGQVTVPM